ncbi:hypothetical protein DLM75_19700 [Leptospira stimsonii]|uniref:Uncharacterized protein n=1 Tax=Leptospira stimsonii TaxID=2202203 RepID=A0A396YV16_9LEPT|nr:hypothetical protein DLM75_19700 [Leptospira stimsonii]
MERDSEKNKETDSCSSIDTICPSGKDSIESKGESMVPEVVANFLLGGNFPAFGLLRTMIRFPIFYPFVLCAVPLSDTLL